MDINLPDLDGFNVFNRIKSNPLTREIPVIALSANAMSGYREKALDMGFDAYMDKPFNMVDMIKTFNTLIKD